VSETLQRPRRVILGRKPFEGLAGVEIVKYGQVYDEPGETHDFNTESDSDTKNPESGIWRRTAFLLQTSSRRRYFGRPALLIQNYQTMKAHANTGIIIDLTAALRGERDPERLTVALPGKVLGRMTIGQAFEHLPEAGEITRIVAIDPDDFELVLTDRQLLADEAVFHYRATDELQKISAILGTSAWELATNCLWAVKADGSQNR